MTASITGSLNMGLSPGDDEPCDVGTGAAFCGGSLLPRWLVSRH
jgi:hypothetical protein